MGIVVLGAPAPARADDFVPVQIAYEPRAGCPSADAFIRELLARAPRARLALPGEQARTLVARVRLAAGHGLEGSLVVREPAAAPTERVVRAESCDEVVTALAVIAAVVIDPVTARTGSIDTTAPSADAKPPADDGPPAPAPLAPARPPEVPAPESAPAPPAERRRWTVSAGLGGGLVAGSAPTVLLSVPAFVEVSQDRRDLVSPSMRLRFERTFTSSNGEGGAFLRTGGATDLCPIALTARSLRAQPCVRAELAALSAKGRGVEPVRSDVRPWFAVGAVARVRIELAPPVFVELEASVFVPAVRDRFYVEPFAVVYRAPAVGGASAFALGASF